MRRAALLMVLLATFQISFAQSPAFERAASLQHGINLSGWFASSGDLSQQHFDTFTNEADLKLIHEMGFDSVRLGVEPSLIVRHGQLNPANPDAVAHLDHSITGSRQSSRGDALRLSQYDYKRNLATDAE